jgi:hypothetical protein
MKQIVRVAAGGRGMLTLAGAIVSVLFMVVPVANAIQRQEPGATKSTLTAESPTTIRVEPDTTETFTVLFTVDPQLADGIAVDQDATGAAHVITARLTDLRSSDGALFSTAKVDGLRINSGREALEVPITVDAGDGVSAADYTGQLVVSGTGITPGRASVTLKVVQEPPWTEGKRYGLAALLLAAGVLAGALLTWLNSNGSRLTAAHRRLASIDVRISGLESWLPDGFKQERATAWAALVAYDATGVEASLAKLSADSEVGLDPVSLTP